MNIAVRYYTKTGNTKKLAEAIGEAINQPALTIDTPLTEFVDILFLGSSVYAANISSEVKNFIVSNKDKIGKIVNFSTAAALPSTYNQVSKVAKENNVIMAEDEFHCRGSFAIMHKGHPDDLDYQNAKEFALKIVNK